MVAKSKPETNGNGEAPVVETQEMPIIPQLPTPMHIDAGESLVSSNFRWQSNDGFILQTTIRHGATLDDVMENFDVVVAALEILGSMGVKPVGGSSAGTPVNTLPGVPEPTGPDYCQVHKVIIKKYDRDNKVWYAHQHDGTWCNEKDRKAAGFDH